MNISRKQLEWIQLALGGVVVFISALLAADPVRSGLGLWFGGVWIYFAWRFAFSPVLTALLVFMALRGSASTGLPASWFLAVNLGVTAFGLSFWLRNRITAVVSALCWSLILWVSAPLCLLVLAGLPRLCKIYEEERKWFLVPALISIVGALSLDVTQGVFTELLQRPLDSETYQQLQGVFLGLFSVESLWRVIPIVGIFEVAQKQPDDHRITWRNLVLFGAICSWILVPALPAMQMTYLVGVPLSVLMLSRWGFVLPDRISRSVYWMGLAGMAIPFLQGGLN